MVQGEREFVGGLDLFAERLKVSQKSLGCLLKISILQRIFVFEHFLSEEDKVGFQQTDCDLKNARVVGLS